MNSKISIISNITNILSNRAAALKLIVSGAAAAVSGLLCSSAGLCQTYETILQYKEPVSNFNFDFTSTLIKFILATAICITIILLMKKYMGGASGFSQGDNIKVLDYQMIASEKYIYVVEIYSKIFVLGVSGAGISNISEITDRETIDAIKLKSDKNIKGKMFSEYLQKFMPADKSNPEQ